MGSGLFGLIYVICQIMFVQVRILSMYIHLYVPGLYIGIS